MQLRLIDEHNDRGHLLWAEEPVGLALRGETQQAALSKLPAELTAYRRWLGLPPVPAVGVITQEAGQPSQRPRCRQRHPAALRAPPPDGGGV